jgi:hypothetical protein
MFKDQLQAFLQSSMRNQWVETDRFNIYLRKGVHCIDGELQKCLDLATFEVFPQFRRQGVFKHLLLTCQDCNPFPVLYIENVVNKHLHKYLQQHPQMLQIYSSPPCFYMVQQ